MKYPVLVLCEFSGRVRDAFLRAGHDAWSCDLLPSEADGPHYQCDVFEAMEKQRWGLIIAHPPCTHLAVSGNRWYAGTQERTDAIAWTRLLWRMACAKAERVALENPVSVLSTEWRAPDQYIHPWQYGHPETKKTGLWLYNLPKLAPTNIVDGREPRVHHASPGPDRWKERSRTLPGIAQAFADQWGSL